MDKDKKSFRTTVRSILAAAPDEFKLSELAPQSKIPVDEWETAVDSDADFFRDGDRVSRRSSVFRGREFLITPEQWEIDAGILVPGHRFVPYLDPEVFPSEVVLRTGRRRIRTREDKFPVARIIGCFMLLGSEQMLDVLLAESPDNAFLRSGATGDREVGLTVFDLADFYREHDFEEGDALKCEVVDYLSGEVKFSFVSGSERAASDKRKFISSLDAACEAAIREAGDYLDIPEIFAKSFFLGGDALKTPAASLDEFIRESLKIVLGSDADGHSSLRVAGGAETDDDDEPPPLPEGLSISSGEIGTLPAMLKATGSAVTPEELDGFILDACATREMDFSSVFARAFRHAPEFVDAAQEAAFMNEVEDRFEELTRHYDRVDDELKAPLRSNVMEAVEERLEFFSEAAALEHGAETLTPEKLRRLAAVASRIDELLKLLNREDFMPDAHEVGHLEAQLETFLDEQDAALEALREDLTKPNPKRNDKDE